MEFSEKELEDMIWNQLERKNHFLLNDKGLDFISEDYEYFRQPNLYSYGRPDMVGLKVDQLEDCFVFNSQVIELKAKSICMPTLSQSMRYAVGLASFLKKSYPECRIRQPKIFMVGTHMDFNDDFCYLNTCSDTMSYYIASFDINDGAVFNKPHMYLKSPDFDLSKSFISDFKNRIK